MDQNSQSVADQIAAMRAMLASNDKNRKVSLMGDGTILNPAGGNSLDTNQPVSVVDAPVVAAQWYKANPGLKQAEIQAMREFHSKAKYGYLKDGRMYWEIALHPKVLGERKEWVFLAVYDEDHPKQRWGGSVKFYPVRPNYAEMMELVNRSPVTPKRIPHTLSDNEHQIYVCSQHYTLIKAGNKKGEEVTSASACLRNVIYWVNMFEWGLKDQAIWAEFQTERRP